MIAFVNQVARVIMQLGAKVPSANFPEWLRFSTMPQKSMQLGARVLWASFSQWLPFSTKPQKSMQLGARTRAASFSQWLHLSARPQESMQSGVQLITHAIAFGDKAPLTHAWNRIFGKAPTWLCMHPSFGQGPN